MRTITLRHLDNREFARIQHSILAEDVLNAVCFEFECFDDDVSFEENEDGSLISVCGQPVAQSYVSYGRF